MHCAKGDCGAICKRAAQRKLLLLAETGTLYEVGRLTGLSVFGGRSAAHTPCRTQ
jgi:hypothetical protein